MMSSPRVPADWRDGAIIPLFKGKGSKTDCCSYRAISYLSVPGKVLAFVLLHRLNPLLAEHRRPQQSGFTAGIFTADAILALRLFVELHSEFKSPLYVFYVDLKSAFDSVDRTALWLALKGIGIPDVILRLLQNLHADMGARVRVGSDVSERFHTSSGVRQGCVLTAHLPAQRSKDQPHHIWVIRQTLQVMHCLDRMSFVEYGGGGQLKEWRRITKASCLCSSLSLDRASLRASRRELRATSAFWGAFAQII